MSKTKTVTMTVDGDDMDLDRRGVEANERIAAAVSEAFAGGLAALQLEHWRLANRVKREELESILLVRLGTIRRMEREFGSVADMVEDAHAQAQRNDDGR